MKSKTCISKKPNCITQYCEDFLGIVWDCVGLIKLCVFTPTPRLKPCYNTVGSYD